MKSNRLPKKLKAIKEFLETNPRYREPGYYEVKLADLEEMLKKEDAE